MLRGSSPTHARARGGERDETAETEEEEEEKRSHAANNPD